jgi:hypothetical protein
MLVVIDQRTPEPYWTLSGGSWIAMGSWYRRSFAARRNGNTVRLSPWLVISYGKAYLVKDELDQPDAITQ